MDFSLTEDQQAFVASARAFAEGVLAPNAALGAGMDLSQRGPTAGR